jgi:hypothetical protein
MNTWVKNVSNVLLAATLVSSCVTKKPEVNEVDYKTGMMEADRAFSKMSEERGIKNALMHYIEDKGVL